MRQKPTELNIKEVNTPLTASPGQETQQQESPMQAAASAAIETVVEAAEELTQKIFSSSPSDTDKAQETFTKAFTETVDMTPSGEEMKPVDDGVGQSLTDVIKEAHEIVEKVKEKIGAASTTETKESKTPPPSPSKDGANEEEEELQKKPELSQVAEEECEEEEKETEVS